MTAAPLVLASTSRYRRELLGRLHLPFTIMASGVDETALPGEPPEILVARLASAKAGALRNACPTALIIGGDQLAVFDGNTIGKPANHDDAVRQLRAARGKSMLFLTALCLLNARSGQRQQCIVPARVRMRDLDDAEIERYLEAERPYDCAGSAKIEGLGIALVDKLECEDPTALIGLPLIKLCAMLRNEGVAIP